jgi:formylglycine-generating enzyme
VVDRERDGDPPVTSGPVPGDVAGMTWIPGGGFLMGSDDFYPEERPARNASVQGFWMDTHPVTNAQFARFVRHTGYVTVAERPLDPAHFPGADPALLVPGSVVFVPTTGPVDLDDNSNWWVYMPAACWTRPDGPGSTVEGLDQHPVVHVALEDAAAYAAWTGRELPTEVEWERAARGGLHGATFAWGEEHFPGGRPMANSWQGEFPWQNTELDGYARTSPVGVFPANGYGLHDMTGNVWEWTVTPYSVAPAAAPQGHACCSPSPPGVAHHASSPEATVDASGRRVVKGGSHLCAPNYCLRYRPAARQPQTVDTSTSHMGFRCVAHRPPP